MASKPLPLDPALADRTQKLPDSAEDILTPNVQHEERTFSASDGTELIMSIFSRKRAPGEKTSEKRPALYHTHGGGFFQGTRFLSCPWMMQIIDKLDFVGMSAEYRLAPDHPDPVPTEDCYAGLVWMVEQAEEFGIDPARIVIGGGSAGGGLAAAVALMARDRGGPRLLGQIVSMPQLDDRCDTFSAHQPVIEGVLNRAGCVWCWDAYLGERRGTSDVSIYASPSRATDLSGLPPAYIDAGEAEPFRDEAIAYAQRLWRDGVSCELHIWKGAFHGFELMCPQVPVSVTACESKLSWVERLLSSGKAP